MFLVAVYESYLGITPAEAAGSGGKGQDVRLVRPAGSGSATFSYYGRTVVMTVQGSGSQPSLQSRHAWLHTALIPASLLCTGCTVRAIWAG
jgi:hypothetical protein